MLKSRELIAKVLNKIGSQGNQLTRDELKAAITRHKEKFTSKELEYLSDLLNNFSEYDIHRQNNKLDDREIALAIYR